MSDLDEGSLTYDYDEPRNLLKVAGAGTWTLSLLQLHWRPFEALVRQARQRYGQIRVHYDVREVAIQSPEVNKLLAEVVEKLYRPYDRLAIVAASEPVRVQMREVERRATTEIFLNPETAERWLFALDNASSGTKLELEWGPVEDPAQPAG
jgi:hypothetical protein